ncbi:hypothetical protein [Colwellia echini]|uniref:Uncharacterized protein n=1 Tax=Colwellia echini TaxID=1982103 RepID=A0ABY3MSH3_9GAMM|nr:hypothetical protein [Colwellia echini]TYK64140.1 hypothetical protein CWS31_017255 [Colwellia echini]
MSQQNWKDHPLSSAAVAVAGTIAIGVLLYKEVILPTHTLSLQNEISSLKSDISKSKEKIREQSLLLKSANTSLNKFKDENIALKGQLISSQISNLFVPNNPYPLGLAQVRIGDPASKIHDFFKPSIFPDSLIEVEPANRYITVKYAHSAFKHVTYFLDEDKPELPITHINFSGFDHSSTSRDILQEKLIANHGNPDSTPRKGFYSWDGEFKTTIFKSDSKSYVLMEHGFILGYWPKKS